MARSGKGILDGFTGKLGTVIGGNWKGISYMRSAPVKNKNRKHSEKQLIQQAKFGTTTRFLHSMRDLLNLTFPGEKEMSRINAAVSDALNGAITGVYPDFKLDYQAVKLSFGPLLPARQAAAVPAPKGVQFTWSTDKGIGKASDEDKAVLIAYHPESNTSLFTTTAAIRSAGTGVLDVGVSGEELETWIAFISPTGEMASASFYTGKVITG